MELTELLILIILSIFQSIFGIGLLVFGTPTFLILGYDFIEVLNILLPFSISISLLQILFGKNNDKKFTSSLMIYCVPALLISLTIMIQYQYSINFILLTSITIIIFSIINLINFKNFIINNSNIRMNSSLIILGIIHGLTNLGGSLLTLISTNINNSKDSIRHNIALGYFLLGTVQLIFINISGPSIDLQSINYLYLPIICFFIAKTIYQKITSEHFSRTLNIIVLIYGIIIFLNNIT